MLCTAYTLPVESFPGVIPEFLNMAAVLLSPKRSSSFF